MATDSEPAAVATYEAERIVGPDGAVQKGNTALTDEEAVTRLKDGNDIVVCGKERRANRNKARKLMEAAFGGFVEDKPHTGRMALPHFHPPARDPEETHAFFESPPRHARKKK